jgi:threonine/homoserine/homoserine lactone efflux protein
MSWYGLISFCVVYGVAVATPGPGIAAVIARSLARGIPGSAAFIAGFVVGDLIWFLAAALGLSALAHAVPALFAILRYAGAAYLLWIAIKLWISPVRELSADTVPEVEKTALRTFIGSLTLTLGNPKPMLFFVALLPTVVPLDSLDARGYLAIALAIAVILPSILGAYVLAAARARRWFRSARANKILNRGSGALMAAAAVAVATR